MEMYALSHKVDSIFTVHSWTYTMYKLRYMYTVAKNVQYCIAKLFNLMKAITKSLQSSGGMCLIICPHNAW